MSTPLRTFAIDPAEAPDEITINLVLRHTPARRLVAAAARYRREPVELLAELIETILRDDLVGAVIDETVPPANVGNGSTGR